VGDSELNTLHVGFQRRPVDLYILLALTAFSTSWVTLTGRGTALASIPVLFSPGYMVAATVYPKSSSLPWASRVLLGTVLSMAVVSMLAVVLDFSPWGARAEVVEGVLAAFTVAMGFIAFLRRTKIPINERLSASIEIRKPMWRGLAAPDRILAIALGVSITLGFGLAVSLVTSPRPVEHFSEFFLLGPGGNASNYPTFLKTLQDGSVTIGIVNHEASTVRYRVLVDLVAVRFAYNSTSGINETIEINRTTLSSFTAVPQQGQSWTLPYTFRIIYTGFWKVQFLLFKDSDLSSIYRELHLFVRVT